MLGQRLIAAAIIISTMLVIVWLDFQLGTTSYLGRPGIVFAILAIVVSALAAFELVEMWATSGQRLNRTLAIVSTVAMVGVSSLPVLWRDYPVDCTIGKFGWSISGLVIGLVIVFFYEMFQFSFQSETAPSKPGEFTDRIARYALCLCYLQMLFGFLAAHRLIDGSSDSNSIGMISIITLIATAKMSDACAYFTGKSIGKTKLAPKLSPKKTVEGAMGAFVGAWIAAAIVLFVVAPYLFGVQIEKPWWWFLAYGFLVTLAGMAGDLFVSLMKRDANCKDSSNWLPGLGGILDVMDSLVFATSVSYFLWI